MTSSTFSSTGTSARIWPLGHPPSETWPVPREPIDPTLDEYIPDPGIPGGTLSSVVPRNMPEKLRKYRVYPDYRDAVDAYRKNIPEYLEEKEKLRTSWFRRTFKGKSRLEDLRGYPLWAFAEVYCVDPELALEGLRVFLDPVPLATTGAHYACQKPVLKTFTYIAKHRLPKIPNNLYPTALHCLGVMERFGMKRNLLPKLRAAREAIVSSK